MKDHIALVNKLGHDGHVMHRIYCVVIARVRLQMHDIVNRAGRKIVNAENLVAALDVCVGEVRSDEARPACD